MRKTERSYYASKFETYKSNLKLTWHLIKNLIDGKQSKMCDFDQFVDNGNVFHDKESIATKFNQFFANIGPTLAKQIPPSNTNYNTFLKGSYKDSFCLFDTDPNEIISAANGMPNKTSSGWDELPCNVFKTVLPCLATPLCTLINKSFREAAYQTSLK